MTELVKVVACDLASIRMMHEIARWKSEHEAIADHRLILSLIEQVDLPAQSDVAMVPEPKLHLRGYYAPP